MIDVQRRPEELEGPLQAFDRHVDPGAEASGIRQDDFHRAMSFVPGARPRRSKPSWHRPAQARSLREACLRAPIVCGGRPEGKPSRRRASASDRRGCARSQRRPALVPPAPLESRGPASATVPGEESGQSATASGGAVVLNPGERPVCDGHEVGASDRVDGRRAGADSTARRARSAWSGSGPAACRWPSAWPRSSRGSPAPRSRSAPSTSPSTATTWAGRRPGPCSAAPRSPSTSRAPTSCWWMTSSSPAGRSAPP